MCDAFARCTRALIHAESHLLNLLSPSILSFGSGEPGASSEHPRASDSRVDLTLEIHDIVRQKLERLTIIMAAIKL